MQIQHHVNEPCRPAHHKPPLGCYLTCSMRSRVSSRNWTKQQTLKKDSNFPDNVHRHRVGASLLGTPIWNYCHPRLVKEKGTEPHQDQTQLLITCIWDKMIWQSFQTEFELFTHCFPPLNVHKFKMLIGSEWICPSAQVSPSATEISFIFCASVIHPEMLFQNKNNTSVTSKIFIKQKQVKIPKIRSFTCRLSNTDESNHVLFCFACCCVHVSLQQQYRVCAGQECVCSCVSIFTHTNTHFIPHILFLFFQLSPHLKAEWRRGGDREREGKTETEREKGGVNRFSRYTEA